MDSRTFGSCAESWMAGFSGRPAEPIRAPRTDVAFTMQLYNVVVHAHIPDRHQQRIEAIKSQVQISRRNTSLSFKSQRMWQVRQTPQTRLTLQVTSQDTSLSFCEICGRTLHHRSQITRFDRLNSSNRSKNDCRGRLWYCAMSRMQRNWSG